MAATYDLTTTVGKIRLLIHDTDVSAAKVTFSDDELTFFYTEGGSLYAGAALALRSWAAKLSRQEKSVRLGEWQGDKKDPVSEMLKLAEEYDRNASRRTVVFKHARMDWTPAAQAEREIAESETDE